MHNSLDVNEYLVKANPPPGIPRPRFRVPPHGPFRQVPPGLASPHDISL